MPWQSDGAEGGGKYSYHPGGDKSKAVKDAPSAVNTVIVPNVTLPKVCKKFAKTRDIADRLYSDYTTSIISGAKMVIRHAGLWFRQRSRQIKCMCNKSRLSNPSQRSADFVYSTETV